MAADRFGALIAALVERGWYVGGGLLAMEHVEALEREARSLWNVGGYHHGGIGHDHGHAVKPDIRGDSICWIEESFDSEAVRSYRSVANELREILNRELFVGLESIEIQFARYPVGAHYDRHVDRFADRTLRTISCILYLNPDWTSDDGGELRLHLAEGVYDVLPEAGRWVVFRSELIEHEVRPARRERYSLTGWFRRRPIHPLR